MSIDFGKMVGPLPMGAWVVVVGGGLAAMYWNSRQVGSGAAGGYALVNNSTQDGVGEGGSGQWVDLTPRTTGGYQEPAIETNDQWAKAAIDYLIASGYDPNLSQQAISRMIAGLQLTTAEAALTRIALSKLGSPPSPLSASEPNVPTAPQTSVVKKLKSVWRDAQARVWAVYDDGSTKHLSRAEWIAIGAPTAFTKDEYRKPAAKPVASSNRTRTYTVKRGDTLSKIASRYPGQSWQRIYNANKSKIKNPNRIYPGTVLTIPN